ncbi:MAG: DUF2203 domain-containing protein [Phycisphaeraceae bacterium]
MNRRNTKTVDAPAADDRKFFTLEEARRALPYVARVVKDIMACYSYVLELRERLEIPRPDDTTSELKRDYETGMEKLNTLLEEMQQVGVELKDFERGLVDFPAWHDGREVCLCWHVGESSIGAWHELDAGFAGRQDITLLEPVIAGKRNANPAN